MEQEIPQTMKGIQKLKRAPVELDIFLTYNEDEKVDKNHSARFKADPKSKLTVWMHPMTRNEWTDVESIYIEAYRHFITRGASPEDASWKANREQDCQQIYFIIKVGPEKDAKRLFSEEEAVLLEYPEVRRLMKFYNDMFVPTKEEQKNCLRERLGKSSETPSTSPNTSKARN